MNIQTRSLLCLLALLQTQKPSGQSCPSQLRLQTVSRVWVLDEQPAHSTFAYFYFYNLLLLLFAPFTHQHAAVCKVQLPLQS